MADDVVMPFTVDSRQPISSNLKDAIASHLALIPEGKRAAMLVIADEHGARVHLAAKVGNSWKVAFEAGRAWTGPVSAQVMVEGSW